MKNLSIFAGMSAAITMAFAPCGFTQAPPPVPLPPSPSKPASVTQEQRKIPALTIQSGPMAEAVSQLNAAMKAAQIAEPNVIYSPGTEGAQVPNLTLRNIRGADALQLIAASAGCGVEQVSASDGEIIGHRIVGQPGLGDPMLGGAGLFGGAGVPGTGVGMGGGLPQPAPHHPQPAPRTASLEAGSASVGASPAGISGGMPGMPGMIMSFGDSPNAPAVRVYPLGLTTTVVKFAEVESTLREVLKTAGIAGEEAKLALHEKTNVLVVTGSNRVHELVKQLLDSLEKNHLASTAAASREDASHRDVIELQLRLEAERSERQRLAKLLEENGRELRAVLVELERAKVAKPQ